MIRNICTDRFFLMQPSEPATAADLPVAQDLRDTLAAHRQGCVGMAANMIGVRRRIIIFDDNGTPTVMLNPVILRRTEPYTAEEGCLSLTGKRTARRWRSIKVQWQNERLQTRVRTFTGADHPARDRPLRRRAHLKQKIPARCLQAPGGFCILGAKGGRSMRNTTLCYIERGQQYLMLHRVKKENDLNHDKWVGIGGKFEGNETPDECLLREAYEETGLTLTDWRCRGVVTFLSDTWEGEYMYLFTAGGFTGTLRACNEGVLSWVDKAAVPALPMWECDKIFFRLLAEDAPFFLLKLRYEGDTLVEAALNGAPVAL